MQKPDFDWALEQLRNDDFNPYTMVPLKELLFHALKTFPQGATVGEIRTYFRDKWDLDIPVRRLTISLSHLKSAGVGCGPGRVWMLN